MVNCFISLLHFAWVGKAWLPDSRVHFKPNNLQNPSSLLSTGVLREKNDTSAMLREARKPGPCIIMFIQNVTGVSFTSNFSSQPFGSTWSKCIIPLEWQMQIPQLTRRIGMCWDREWNIFLVKIGPPGAASLLPSIHPGLLSHALRVSAVLATDLLYGAWTVLSEKKVSTLRILRQ